MSLIRYLLTENSIKVRCPVCGRKSWAYGLATTIPDVRYSYLESLGEIQFGSLSNVYVLGKYSNYIHNRPVSHEGGCWNSRIFLA